MEQTLSNEIVRFLLKRDIHARELAKELKTNHMTVSRKLRKLMEMNIVDFETNGRNKTFYLKKTTEAKNAILTAEIYRLDTFLKKNPNLRNIIKKIKDDKEIELAIIFGSYAKGTQTRNSDIDIFIETINKKLKQKVESFDSRINVKIGKYDKTNALIKEIEKYHVIIKGVELFFS